MVELDRQEALNRAEQACGWNHLTIQDALADAIQQAWFDGATARPVNAVLLMDNHGFIEARLYYSTGTYARGIGKSVAEAIGLLVCRCNERFFIPEFRIVEKWPGEL